jgi:hypothetical protein
MLLNPLERLQLVAGVHALDVHVVGLLDALHGGVHVAQGRRHDAREAAPEDDRDDRRDGEDGQRVEQVAAHDRLDVGHVERREHAHRAEAPVELPGLEALHGPRAMARAHDRGVGGARDAHRVARELLRRADDLLVVAEDRERQLEPQLRAGVLQVLRVHGHAREDRADPGQRRADDVRRGRGRRLRLAPVIDHATELRALEHRGHLGDEADRVGRVVAADLREHLAVGLHEQHVDVRVDVDEDLRELPRARRVLRLDGARRRAVGREDARREGEVIEIVVELRLERALGVGDAIVHLVDELPVQEPREDRQRRQHDHDRERNERGQLRSDRGELEQHRGRSYRRSRRQARRGKTRPVASIVRRGLSPSSGGRSSPPKPPNADCRRILELIPGPGRSARRAWSRGAASLRRRCTCEAAGSIASARTTSRRAPAWSTWASSR